MQIQKLTKEYLKEASELAMSVILESPYYNEHAKEAEVKAFTVESIQKDLQSHDKHFLIAIEDKEICGIIRYSLNADLILLNWIVVDANHRGRGVGRSLVKGLEAEAKSLNCHKVWLDTRTNNLESIALFEKLGYQKVCELKNHWYGLDYFIWEKLI